ncbi:DsbC family protein [Lysobacter sp. CFH 32150]|uniref:DsbC family protein n=1 Tax=Lysobacter sp. CFH 32150 TaxID=2927128 RepID=UPI001FA70DE3|nr:DsbC family protein [Lysobacter sp. CFH 32150]MCI4567666.1 DsbC family protein [Lysobacter sp. CFH 32150]
MKRTLFAVLGAISLSACAQAPSPAATAAKPGAQSTPTAPGKAEATVVAGTPEARAREALRKLNPQIKVDQIGAAPIAGFREVIVGGQVVYVSDDGKYLLQGSLYDIENKKNLGEASLAKVRTELLKSIPASDRIVFAPPNPKHTVTVFTDIECGYCRKLHNEIAEYNRQGIAVEYLAFPRAGLGSADFKHMVSVWCATDKKKALTDAKNDKPVPAKDCKNPVTMQYDLGQRMGLTGTPMILARDGTQLGGYLPPAQLRAALDKLAGGGKPAAKSEAADPVAATGTGA